MSSPSEFLTDVALTSRRELRRHMRMRRRLLSGVRQRQAAQALARHVCRQPAVRSASRIALYLAADGEIDTGVLLAALLARGKRIYLPVVHAGRVLRFCRFPAPVMRRNRFGIAEPQGGTIPADRLDLVFLPLVAFDRRGGRLGMGGGFYDRSFAFLCAGDGIRREGGHRSGGMRPRLVGLAHRFQEVDALPLAPWDVPLAAVATEREWIRVRR